MRELHFHRLLSVICYCANLDVWPLSSNAGDFRGRFAVCNDTKSRITVDRWHRWWHSEVSPGYLPSHNVRCHPLARFLELREKIALNTWIVFVSHGENQKDFGVWHFFHLFPHEKFTLKWIWWKWLWHHLITLTDYMQIDTSADFWVGRNARNRKWIAWAWT